MTDRRFHSKSQHTVFAGAVSLFLSIVCHFYRCQCFNECKRFYVACACVAIVSFGRTFVHFSLIVRLLWLCWQTDRVEFWYSCLQRKEHRLEKISFSFCQQPNFVAVLLVFFLSNAVIKSHKSLSFVSSVIRLHVSQFSFLCWFSWHTPFCETVRWDGTSLLLLHYVCFWSLCECSVWTFVISGILVLHTKFGLAEILHSRMCHWMCVWEICTQNKVQWYTCVVVCEIHRDMDISIKFTNEKIHLSLELFPFWTKQRQANTQN